MKTIKRYEIFNASNYPYYKKENIRGQFVLFSDHEKVVKELKDAVKKLNDLIKNNSVLNNS